MNKYQVRVNENGSLVDYEIEADGFNAFSEGVYFNRHQEGEQNWASDVVVAFFRNPISIVKRDPDTQIYDLSVDEDRERLIAKISA